MYDSSHSQANPPNQSLDSQLLIPSHSTSVSITSNTPIQTLEAEPSTSIDQTPLSTEIISNHTPDPDLPNSPLDNPSANIESPSTPPALSPPNSPSSTPLVDLPPVIRRQPSRAREDRSACDKILSSAFAPAIQNDVYLVETTDCVDENIMFQQARLDPSWAAAMREEIDSLIQHDTWVLTALPPGKQAISARWVYRAKPEINPTRTQLKAHLVARGIEQRSGVDFEDTFAPVVKWSTIHLIIALAAAHGWPITQMDVTYSKPLSIRFGVK